MMIAFFLSIVIEGVILIKNPTSYRASRLVDLSYRQPGLLPPFDPACLSLQPGRLIRIAAMLAI